MLSRFYVAVVVCFKLCCCMNEGERYNTLSGVFVPFDPLNSLHIFSFSIENSGLNDSNFRHIQNYNFHAIKTFYEFILKWIYLVLLFL